MTPTDGPLLEPAGSGQARLTPLGSIVVQRIRARPYLSGGSESGWETGRSLFPPSTGRTRVG